MSRANSYTQGRHGYQTPNKWRCRHKGCGGYGFNGYCSTHTPARGVGLIRCLVCHKPLRDHSLLERCG